MELFRKLFGSMNRKLEKASVPRQPRIELHNLHQVSCLVRKKDSLVPVTLKNISIGGLAFSYLESLGDVVSKQRWTVYIQVGAQRFEIKIEIVHITNGFVGCLMLNPSPEVNKALLHYFQTELSGMAIHKVEPEKIADRLNTLEAEHTASCYKGQHNSELFLVEKNMELNRFSIALYGGYFEWVRGNKGRFGWMPNDPVDPYAFGQSASVQWDQEPPKAWILLCSRFVRSIPQISDEFKAFVLTRVENTRASHSAS
jgi:hypothetical protein